MHRTRTVDDILRTCFPRANLTPGARSVTRTLLSGGSALMVAPDPSERELAWQPAARAGRLPALVVAASEHGLAARADRLARRLDLIACHLHARMTDEALSTLATQFADGKWDVAFVSGRGLSDPRMMAAARAMAPRLLVVEDAQRVTLHGRDYDPAWPLAAEVAAASGSVLALSDLADARARAEITECLAPEGCTEVLSGLDRPGLRLACIRAQSPAQKDGFLLGLFVEAPERGVIYANDPADAERLTALIREERGFDAQNLTHTDPQQFDATVRRFREGGLRVLVGPEDLTPDADWPEIPVAAGFGLPRSLELLHRQLHVSRGEGAQGAIVYERDEMQEDDEAEPDEDLLEDDLLDEDEYVMPHYERAAMTVAPEIGHMLALHEAATSGEALSHIELTRRTGLSDPHVTLGLGALIRAGALRPLERGDTWLRAETGTPLRAEVLNSWAAEAAEMRMLAVARAEEVPEFAASQRCRREGLADALGYALTPGKCNCDRCRREAPLRVSARIPGGYPIKAGGFRGWALALVGRPGAARAGQDPARLLMALRTRGDEGCGRRLAFAMHRRVKTSRTFRDCDVVVPMPEPPAEGRQPPAELLAREIGRLSAIPVAMALRCAEDGQAEEGHYPVEVTSTELVEGSHVLLVDDIFDSGGSMHEAAHRLIRAGARDVRLLTAVRTPETRRRS